MILSDKTIMRMLKEKTLKIEPVTDEQIQPASVDIRLGNTFSVVDDSPSSVITLEKEINYKTITTDTYLIMPGQFVLATTNGVFRTAEQSDRICGRKKLSWKNGFIHPECRLGRSRIQRRDHSRTV